MGLFRRRQESSRSAELTSVNEEETEAAPVTPPTVEDMTADEVLAVVRYRLAEESYVRFSPTPPADVVEFAPGIVRHLVLDLPDSVETVPAQVLLDKAPILALREAAEANTRAVLDEAWQVDHAGEGAGAVHLIVGESLFTATLALYLPELVTRIAHDADLDAGIIFAVPSRHQLGLHVPVDAAAVRDILPALSRYASHGYDEGAGPISPQLYYWHDDTISVLSSTDTSSSSASITPNGPLLALLGDTPV